MRGRRGDTQREKVPKKERSLSLTRRNTVSDLDIARTTPDVAEYKGFVTKCGGSVRSWKKRWMVLRGDVILYFAKESANKPKGQLQLELEDSAHEVNNSDKSEFMFAINTSKRTYLMYPDSARERSEWIAKITFAVQQLNRIKSSSAAKIGSGVVPVAATTMRPGGLSQSARFPTTTRVVSAMSVDSGQAVVMSRGQGAGEKRKVSAPAMFGMRGDDDDDDDDDNESDGGSSNSAQAAAVWDAMAQCDKVGDALDLWRRKRGARWANVGQRCIWRLWLRCVPRELQAGDWRGEVDEEDFDDDDDNEEEGGGDEDKYAERAANDAQELTEILAQAKSEKSCKKVKMVHFSLRSAVDGSLCGCECSGSYTLILQALVDFMYAVSMAPRETEMLKGLLQVIAPKTLNMWIEMSTAGEAVAGYTLPLIVSDEEPDVSPEVVRVIGHAKMSAFYSANASRLRVTRVSRLCGDECAFVLWVSVFAHQVEMVYRSIEGFPPLSLSHVKGLRMLGKELRGEFLRLHCMDDGSVGAVEVVTPWAEEGGSNQNTTPKHPPSHKCFKINSKGVATEIHEWNGSLNLKEKLIV